MYRVVILALLAAAVMLMGAQGCEEIEIPDLGEYDHQRNDINDEDYRCTEYSSEDDYPVAACHDGDDDWDDDWKNDRCHPTCEDLGNVFFGPCGKMLGFGVAFGHCERIEGCKGADVELFRSRGHCMKGCMGGTTEKELCQETGGIWDPDSCGHYKCGQFPSCDAIIPGCDCGPHRTFVEGEGCVCDPACGGDQVCDGNEDCHESKYCYFSVEAHCGSYGTGTCQVKPELCPDVYDPVCGCDGKTYGNACDAGNQGVSVLHEGECPSDKECEQDSDCYLFADYCGGCFCEATPGDPPPDACSDDDEVACFADPCMNKQAICHFGLCLAL